jgi:hypothetical protein
MENNSIIFATVTCILAKLGVRTIFGYKVFFSNRRPFWGCVLYSGAYYIREITVPFVKISGKLLENIKRKSSENIYLKEN